MENRDFYFRNFVILTVTIFIVSSAVILIFQKETGIDFISFLTAGLICVLNSVFGLKLILNSINSGQKRFFIVALGSMTARLFLVLIAVVVGLLGFKLSKISFIFALFSYYFLFLAIETFVLVKRINIHKRIES